MIDKLELDYAGIHSLPELLTLLRLNKVPENHYWLYLETYQERKARELGIPLSGQFELTPFCNLDCKMCYVHLHQNQLNGADILSVEQWKNIMLQAHSQGMMNATLSGGECLVYPGFDELYMFLRNLGIKVSVKTNGVLLDKERIAFFNTFMPRSITVSLYGSSNETYKRVTGHAVFDIVYENLLELKKSRFPVNIAITPSRYLYEDVKKIYKLAVQLNIPCFVNLSLFPPRKETGRELCDLTFKEYAEIFSMITESASLPLPDEVELPKYGDNSAPDLGLRCGAGRSFFTVSWNGKLSGCNNLDSLQVDVLDTPFSQSWDLIHKDSLSFPNPQECTNCAYGKVCPPCTAYRSTGAERGHCNPDICKRTSFFVQKGIYSL